MNRVLCVLLCVVLCLSMVACGCRTGEVVDNVVSSEDFSSISDETYWVDNTLDLNEEPNTSDVVDTYASYNLTRWDQEIMFGDLRHPELSEYMGSVSEIYPNVSELQFRVGEDIYGFNYGELEKQYTLFESNSTAYTVSSGYFSQLVFEDAESVNCFDIDGGCFFKGLELGELDKIIDYGFSTVHVVFGESGNYTVKTYVIQEDRSVAFESEYPVVGYSIGGYTDLEEPIKSEYWFRTDVNPWELYVVTENGHLYMFNNIELGYKEYKFCVGKNYTNATDVDKVYGSVTAGVGHYAPVYSKVGDNTSLYTLVSGESIWETEDDIEIRLVLPDGYTTTSVQDIIGCSDSIVIEFNGGSLYAINGIDSYSGGEYTAEFISGLSELNADGKVRSIEGMWYSSNRLYVLLIDGVVYYIDL